MSKNEETASPNIDLSGFDRPNKNFSRLSLRGTQLLWSQEEEWPGERQAISGAMRAHLGSNDEKNTLAVARAECDVAIAKVKALEALESEKSGK